jgi:hypothetical protein
MTVGLIAGEKDRVLGRMGDDVGGRLDSQTLYRGQAASSQYHQVRLIFF